eukprot:TRINITY_DN79735_c0_g1_i1.p1 TRINITY_DN79735_c0_g1~~TRINITY_DN79735_c0_g1_i1.p1  ORF type:complete len:612 (+),score=124.90 TRINITY_DN79735_c0_g1_i1:72-1907(+)
MGTQVVDAATATLWQPKVPSDVPHHATLVAGISPKGRSGTSIGLQAQGQRSLDGTPRTQIPLWSTDSLLNSVDSVRFGEVREFPPEFVDKESRKVQHPRQQVDNWHVKKQTDSLDRFRAQNTEPSTLASTDLSHLPRRQRIQLLEGLVAAADEELKVAHAADSSRQQKERQPVELGSARTRREFQARWGCEKNPRDLAGRRAHSSEAPLPSETNSRSLTNRGSDLLQLSHEDVPSLALEQKLLKDSVPPPVPPPPPVDSSKPPTSSSASATASAGSLQSKMKLHSYAPAANLKRSLRPARWARADEYEEDSAASRDVKDVFEELESATLRLRSINDEFGPGSSDMAYSTAAKMSNLGRILEVQAYTLRQELLLKAVVLVAKGAGQLKVASQPLSGESLAAREPIRRAGEELFASMHSLASAASTGALKADVRSVVAALRALAEAGAGCQEYVDAQLARLQELMHQEPTTFSKAAFLARLAGALGDLYRGAPAQDLPGISARNGATSESRAANQRFLADFTARLVEKFPDFLEQDFANMGWAYPVAYLGETELRLLVLRASEMQVGLQPDSAYCLDTMRQIHGFICAKMPITAATLPPLARRYFDGLPPTGF